MTRRFDGPSAAISMADLMLTMRDAPPATLAGRPVTAVVDLARSDTGLPPTDAVVLEVEGGRVVVRPSGTEPMVKVYVEAVAMVDGDLRDAERSATGGLEALLTALTAWLDDKADR